jgi:hypothetical protein
MAQARVVAADRELYLARSHALTRARIMATMEATKRVLDEVKRARG